MKKIVLSLVLASSLVMAADVADQSIKTNTKFGYMKTDGNTKTETLSLDGSLKKAWGKNSASLTLDGQYGNADDENGKNVTTKSKYLIEAKYAYLFTDTLSFTYLAGYKNDKFSAYDYQAYTGPGIKWNTYKSEKQKLDLEASIFYAQDVLRDVVAPADDTNTYGSYQAKVTYELQVLENLKFNQELSYRSAFDDADNYFVFSDSSLSSKLSDMLSAGISYKIDYANISLGKEKKDTTLAAFISLDY